MATIDRYPKRLIEVDLPIRQISDYALAEKSSRLGHIPRLHIYPAARPVAACRAVICAALWPDPVDLARWDKQAREVILDDGSTVIRPRRFLEEARHQMEDWAKKHLNKASQKTYSQLMKIQKDPSLLDNPEKLRQTLLDFIADFANWDNSIDNNYLGTARSLTLAAYESLGGISGNRPLIVDPFSGGGAIPLEAMRVGADVFASDLNPVAVLLNKIVLEYIPEYGTRLVDEISKWGTWVKRQAEEELAEIYPRDPDGSIPIAYLWARTILSEAPGQGTYPIEVPMLRSMRLTRKRSGKNWALRWVADKDGNVCCEKKEITSTNGTKQTVLQPKMEVFEITGRLPVPEGTIRHGSVTCPVTSYRKFGDCITI